jgi:hypothetical protein
MEVVFDVGSTSVTVVSYVFDLKANPAGTTSLPNGPVNNLVNPFAKFSGVNQVVSRRWVNPVREKHKDKVGQKTFQNIERGRPRGWISDAGAERGPAVSWPSRSESGSLPSGAGWLVEGLHKDKPVGRYTGRCHFSPTTKLAADALVSFLDYDWTLNEP